MSRLNWDRVGLEKRIWREGTESSVHDSLSPGSEPAKRKVATRSSISLKKRKIKKRPISPEQKLLNYLHQVIAADVRQNPLPDIPKKSRAAIAPIVNKAGGTEKWMRSHPKYDEFRRRKLKRLRKQKPDAGAHAEAIHAKSALLHLDEEIQKKLEFIKLAKQTIERVERELDALYEERKKVNASPSDQG